MYTDDNNDVLLYASRHYTVIPPTVRAVITGDMDFNPATAPLGSRCGRQEKARSGVLWQIHRHLEVPSGSFGLVVGGEFKPRVRSMSMNLWVGGFAGYDGNLSGGYARPMVLWRQSVAGLFENVEFVNPGPAGIFLFLDMREDSIDWGNFCHGHDRLAIIPIKSDSTTPGQLPPSRGGFSFADGHSEIHRCGIRAPWRPW